MNQSARHEVQSLMSEAYKAAEGYEHRRALGALTAQVRLQMSGVTGRSAEFYAKRQARALDFVKGAKVLAAFSSPSVLEPLAKAEALLVAEPAEAEVMVVGAEGLTEESVEVF